MPDDRTPPLAATVAFAFVIAVAGWGVAVAALLIVNGPSDLPAPLGQQNQDAETLAYLLAYLVAGPLGLFAGARFASAVAARQGSAAVGVLAPLALAALAATLPVLKLSGVLGVGDGVRALLALGIAWWLAAAAVAVRATRARPWPALRRIPLRGAWMVAGAAIVVACACLTDLSAMSPVGAVVCAVVAAAIGAFAPRLAVRPGRGTARALEALVLVLLLLLIPDLVVFRPEQAAGDPAIAIEDSIIAFHQNFLLGPAGEVLGGGTLLVDTASQYGVGSIYLLAGWFSLAPIGYGTFALLDAVLTVAWFGAGYAVVRLAHTPRPLALGALALAVPVLVLDLAYPVGALPQYGPLRYGMPMLVLLAVVAGERRPDRERAAHAGALLALAVAAAFSLEAILYSAALYGLLVLVQAWLRPAGGRVRWLLRRLLVAVAAAALAHVALALATLARSGALPDWGQYLDYLRVFFTGSIGDITYDVPRWSAGLGVGGLYLLSALGLAALAWRRPALVRTERLAFVTLVGLTGYGIVALSYWDNRSLQHILLHVALPAPFLVAVWTGLARRGDLVPAAVRAGVVALALALAALAGAAAWPSLEERAPRTLLAHVVPGGSGLGDALSRLWDPPPLFTTSRAGQELLERELPGEARSLVFATPDVALEILLRAGRINRLFLGDPRETSFVARDRVPDLRAELAQLRPGMRMLLDDAAVAGLQLLRAAPEADPLSFDPRTQSLALIQLWALQRIQRRFALEPVAAVPGWRVVVLRAR